MHTTDRSCGSCSACCYTHSVLNTRLEVVTRSLELCEHCASPGCAIYESRPHSCRTYNCMWLQGFGTNEHRPDKLGVVIDVLIVPDTPMNVLIFWETRPGTMKTDSVQRIMDQVQSAKSWTVIHIPVTEESSIHFIPKTRKDIQELHTSIWKQLLRGR